MKKQQEASPFYKWQSELKNQTNLYCLIGARTSISVLHVLNFLKWVAPQTELCNIPCLLIFQNYHPVKIWAKVADKKCHRSDDDFGRSDGNSGLDNGDDGGGLWLWEGRAC